MRKNRDALALAAAFPLAFAFPVVAQTQPQPATPAAADARVKSLGIVTIIKENAGCVTVAGDTLGKQQPNIPKWRATSLASYRFDEHWRASLAAPLQRRAVPHPEQRGRQRLHLSRGERVLHYRCPGALRNGQTVDCVVRHRQPEQLRLLELPPLSAAQLHGRVAV